MLLIGLPSALFVVWFCGYVITLPAMQRHEDRASAETTQMRRDIDEILRLLKKNMINRYDVRNAMLDA